MQALQDAPPALTNSQIIAQYGGALEQLNKAADDPQYEFERTIQVNKARRNWQFVKGNHFMVPGLVQTPYGEIADYLIADSPSVAEENGADTKFCYPINVIGGDLYKFMAVMGNAAPRVKAVADDPEDADQIDQAKQAYATLRDLWSKWRADALQRILAFHQYTTGPLFMRTVWVTDRLKYGQSVEPKVELVYIPQPDGSTIPTPQQTGVNTYENGDVELHFYTVLEACGPFMSKDMNMPWFRVEIMRSKWDLLSAFSEGEDGQPGPLEQYRENDPPDDDIQASVTSAQEARESVSNPSGIGRSRRPNEWRFREWWHHPMQYEAITSPQARQIFKRQFPDGLYMAKVGNVNVRIDGRKLTDEFAVCKTGRGEKIFEDPIANDSVPIQRALNDLINLAIETVLRSIAQTIVDSMLLDRTKMSNKEAVPAELIFTALPVDGDLSKRVFQIPPARVSDQLVPLFGMLRTLQQDITGIRPELSGSGPPTSTYREAKQRKDQALLQLSPQAQEMQFAWETAGRNGVRMRAKYGSGLTKVAKKGSFGPETDVVDNARLTDSGWHVEADDNFPMDAADRFDKMWALLKEFPPEVQQQLSILDPINLEETLELLQIPGYESVMDDQKRKTLGDIMQLLKESPQPGQPGPDGSPVPPQSPLPIDDWDDHAFIADFVPKWMNSQTGRNWRQKAPDGFQSVNLWWQAHKDAAQPPPPPPPPPLKGAVNFSGKLEDLGPQVMSEVIQGVGLGAIDPASVPPPLPPPMPKGKAGPGPGGPPPNSGPNQPLPPAPPLQGPGNLPLP